jgi:chromosome segregation ATPase
LDAIAKRVADAAARWGEFQSRGQAAEQAASDAEARHTAATKAIEEARRQIPLMEAEIERLEKLELESRLKEEESRLKKLEAELSLLRDILSPRATTETEAR